ncbi:hypothetical protein [Paenibacillus sp. HJGM_3]|uniref:hypothetical protein n=1 Tax=Paenibacillus sp. HJGM_3 TaxID=3379816 RepID=UPI003858F27D
MAMPIVFIHQNYEEYLIYSLHQAKRSNPQSTVVLIGTEDNAVLGSHLVHHTRMENFMHDARQLATTYKHVSENDYNYNLFCFQRWLILREFMRHHKLAKCCYLDSDVLLYTDVNNPEFQQFTFEFTWTSICDLESLEAFCNLILIGFDDPDVFRGLVRFTYEIGQPALSDMVISHLYTDTRHGLFSDSYFDSNINVQYYDFEMMDGLRKVYLSGDTLYSRRMDSNSFIKLNSLHFQGRAKMYMPYFHMTPTISDGMAVFHYPTRQWIRV